MADSSPVNGYDWLKSSFTYVRENQLRNMLGCIRDLQGADLPIKAVSRISRLLDEIQDDQLTPVVLGRGAGSLEHKTASIIWALWLETGDDDDLLKRICSQSRSWTTDMGTEVGINDFSISKFKDLLSPPLELHEPLRHDAGVAAAPGEGWGELISDVFAPGPSTEAPHLVPDLSGFLFEMSIGASGMMHVLHNALADGSQVMTMWQDLLPKLRRISSFFCQRGYRERFVACCCTGENTKYASLFSAKPPEFITWRWGTLMQWCAWLAPRWQAIQACWNRHFFEQGAPTDDAWDKGKDDLGLAELNNHFKDGVVFGYHVMLIAAGAGVTAFRQWLHSCPCHQRRLQPAQPGGQRPTLASSLCPEERDDVHKDRPCSMVGRWAPEMAAGEHLTIMNRAVAASRVQLMSSLNSVTGLGARDMESSVLEFDALVQHVDATLRVKLNYVECLPFALAGLAHRHEDVARSQALKVMQMYDDHPEPDSHRRVAVKFLHRGIPSAWREQLEAWAAGADSADMLAFRAAAGFRMVPMTEESAERPHGILKKRTSMKPSKAMSSSLAIRWTEIKNHLRRDPAFRGNLLRCMEKALSPSLLSELGLDAHQLVMRERMGTKFTRGARWVTIANKACVLDGARRRRATSQRRSWMAQTRKSTCRPWAVTWPTMRTVAKHWQARHICIVIAS